MKQTWYWVDVHYACYGIVIASGKVIRAAPIASWMIGKTTQEIKPFLIKNKAKVKELKNS